MKRYFAITFTALVLPVVAHGQAYDSESVASGAYTSPVTMTSGSNSVTVSALNAASPILNVSTPNFSGLGDMSCAAFNDTVAFGNNRGQLWDFDNPLSAITFLFGDNGGDDDGFVTIDAYDAANNFVVGGNFFYGTSDTVGSLNLAGTNMDHFMVNSNGTQAPGSLFFEVSATTNGAVPEPASMATLGLGVVALIRRRRSA